jgi:hypothetical protein
MKKKIVYILIGLLAVFIILVVAMGGWSNFKLKMTRVWGFVTIGNNPLLKSYDEDLKNIESESQETRVDLDRLLSGGPPKDGIPSIDDPRLVDISKSEFSQDELIIGVYLNGEARAYPYGILNWHEIINDKIGDLPITVTLCPLCDTNPVFIRKVDGQETTFGVSGKLLDSCLVMYDRLTDSLWSQPWGIGIAGEKNNQVLEKVPSFKTTLGDWQKKHPNSKILSTDTGYNRDYSRYPYGSYYTDKSLIFSVRNKDKLELHPKEIISYVWRFDEQTPKNKFSGESIQVVHKELQENKEQEFDFKNQKIKAVWDEQLKTVVFYDKDNKIIPSSTAFAFVYPAYFK